MRPHRLRLLIVLLLLALVLAACGGGSSDADEEGGSGSNTTASGSDDGSGSDDASSSSSDSGTDSSGGGDNGSISFEISGNWEADGEFVFIPEASAFTNDYWSLSFAPNRDGSGDAIISILLIPESQYITYGDPEFTVGGGGDQCQFDISDQTVDGASGTIECTNLTGIPAGSSMRDGVNFSATFDARS